MANAGKKKYAILGTLTAGAGIGWLLGTTTNGVYNFFSDNPAIQLYPFCGALCLGVVYLAVLSTLDREASVPWEIMAACCFCALIFVRTTQMVGRRVTEMNARNAGTLTTEQALREALGAVSGALSNPSIGIETKKAIHDKVHSMVERANSTPGTLDQIGTRILMHENDEQLKKSTDLDNRRRAYEKSVPCFNYAVETLLGFARQAAAKKGCGFSTDFTSMPVTVSDTLNNEVIATVMVVNTNGFWSFRIELDNRDRTFCRMNIWAGDNSVVFGLVSDGDATVYWPGDVLRQINYRLPADFQQSDFPEARKAIDEKVVEFLKDEVKRLGVIHSGK